MLLLGENRMEWEGLLPIVVLLLIIQAVRFRAQGGKIRLQDFKLWGKDVTPEQCRNNLMGIAVILALTGIGLLFWLVD